MACSAFRVLERPAGVDDTREVPWGRRTFACEVRFGDWYMHFVRGVESCRILARLVLGLRSAVGTCRGVFRLHPLSLTLVLRVGR